MMPARPPTVAPFLVGFFGILTSEQALEAGQGVGAGRAGEGRVRRAELSQVHPKMHPNRLSRGLF